eukprot:3915437-Pyramimonas_sp.AAC.1
MADLTKINYHVTTSVPRRAGRALAERKDDPEQEEADERPQRPLAPESMDLRTKGAPVPALAGPGPTFLRCYVQGAFVTGPRLAHITKCEKYRVSPFCSSPVEDIGHILFRCP